MGYREDLMRPGLTLDQWKAIGKKLMRAYDATNWAIGDWLVYGDGRGDFGDVYTIAQEITGRGLESLSQLARVADAFPPGVRVSSVGWTVHREALRLPERDRPKALELARMNGWGRGSMCSHVNQVQHRTLEAIAGGTSVPADVVQRTHRWRKNGSQQVDQQRVRCPHCHETFGIRRKALAGADVEVASLAMPVIEKVGEA